MLVLVGCKGGGLLVLAGSGKGGECRVRGVLVLYGGVRGGGAG